MITTALATIFVFGVIVFFHELGHFITAKMTGMQVDEFAIGFGPKLVGVQKGETLYSIRLIPLGGFNKIAGMTPDDTSCTPDRAFYNKPAYARFIVISAGAIFNFLLAIAIFFASYAMFGTPQASTQPVIGQVIRNSPAHIAHLQANDRIVSIDNHIVNEWDDISKYLQGTAKHGVSLVIDRNGEREEVTVIPVEDGNRAIIGINPSYTYTKYSIGQSFTMAVDRTGHILTTMIHALATMITGKSEAELAGPVGVAQMAGEVASLGFVYLLNFTALLSLNLGVINLMPLPVLDGGHLVIIVLESITRRKLPAKALQYIQMAGVALLLLLFVYATAQDVQRLF